MSWLDGSSRSYDYSDLSGPLDSGVWTLSESVPGSGNWTLSIDGHQNIDYSGLTSGSLIAAGTIVSTAQFSAENLDSVEAGATEAQGLGGSSSTGGVSASFNQPVPTGGTLTVQQVPDKTGLSQQAIAAAESNPIFALSTSSLAASPQIWNVDFDGNLGEGNFVDLTFAYDASLLPAGFDESTLRIWHFNSAAGEWEFGGTVNPEANTITYTTDHFSDFQMGVLVPEPSSVALAGIAAAALLVTVRRRGAKRRRPPSSV